MLILQEVEFSSNRCVGRPGDSYCRLLLAVAILAIRIILTLKEEGKDDEDFKGFCVFGGKMALFGHNGLSVTDIDVKMTSAHLMSSSSYPFRLQSRVSTPALSRALNVNDKTVNTL